MCERHLLFQRKCQEAVVFVNPRAEAWQTLVLPLLGRSRRAQDKAVPRLRMLNIALLTPGAQMDVANVELRDARGTNLVKNGRFTSGLAHWLPAAQTYFLPWHIDNLYLEVLIERGILGVIAMAALTVLVLWRLTAGQGLRNPLAPFFVASIFGVLLVGLVSSVLDVPRVGFLFFLIIFIANYCGPTTRKEHFN